MCVDELAGVCVDMHAAMSIHALRYEHAVRPVYAMAGFSRVRYDGQREIAYILVVSILSWSVTNTVLHCCSTTQHALCGVVPLSTVLAVIDLKWSKTD